MYVCMYVHSTWFPLYLYLYQHQTQHPPQNSNPLLFQRPNLQYRLPEILPLEHPKESLDGIFNPIGSASLRFEGAIMDPLGHILLMLDRIFGAHVCVRDDEALQFDAFGDHEAQILDRVSV